MPTKLLIAPSPPTFANSELVKNKFSENYQPYQPYFNMAVCI